ncbi:hypothetical protein LTR49_026384 [Elasticomyces elasticus]|nr:hypothetical protein LTR49_026384 [Elasticomyces elasticus]
MVTLVDEGWSAPRDDIGDGSYGYNGAEGVDFVKNLAIKTLDYCNGTLHLYPDLWGYNETWGSTWIQERDEVGKTHKKPVVLEEYGGPPEPAHHAAVERPWQTTVLRDTRLAMDQFWQFGTHFGDQLSSYYPHTIWYNATEYKQLVRDHAAAMLRKRI